MLGYKYFQCPSLYILIVNNFLIYDTAVDGTLSCNNLKWHNELKIATYDSSCNLKRKGAACKVEIHEEAGECTHFASDSAPTVSDFKVEVVYRKPDENKFCQPAFNISFRLFPTALKRIESAVVCMDPIGRMDGNFHFKITFKKPLSSPNSYWIISPTAATKRQESFSFRVYTFPGNVPSQSTDKALPAAMSECRPPASCYASKLLTERIHVFENSICVQIPPLRPTFPADIWLRVFEKKTENLVFNASKRSSFLIPNLPSGSYWILVELLVDNNRSCHKDPEVGCIDFQSRTAGYILEDADKPNHDVNGVHSCEYTSTSDVIIVEKPQEFPLELGILGAALVAVVFVGLFCLLIRRKEFVLSHFSDFCKCSRKRRSPSEESEAERCMSLHLEEDQVLESDRMQQSPSVASDGRSYMSLHFGRNQNLGVDLNSSQPPPVSPPSEGDGVSIANSENEMFITNMAITPLCVSSQHAVCYGRDRQRHCTEVVEENTSYRAGVFC